VLSDAGRDSDRVGLNFVVADVHNAESRRAEHFVADGVRLDLLFVHTTIDLDDQPRTTTTEVDDEPANNKLPSKVRIKQA
jgi:hypothetical protein